jgi:hypothetical protein
MIGLTKFLSWLIGYYYDECPICHRYYAILDSGKIVGFCSKRKHRKIR